MIASGAPQEREDGTRAADTNTGAPQGPGFVKVRDGSRMRMTLVLEMKSTQSWEETFPLPAAADASSSRVDAGSRWKGGGVNFRTARSSSYPGKEQSELHPHVAQSILAPALRRSLRLQRLWGHNDKNGRLVFSIGALEALRIKEEPEDLRVLLVVHTVVDCADYAIVRDVIHARRMFYRLQETLLSILAAEGGCRREALSFPGRSKEDASAPPITTITWVPQAIVSSWRKVSTVAEAHTQGIQVSSEVIDILVTENKLRAEADPSAPSAPQSDTALICAGWQWGLMPATDGIELGDTRFAEALGNLHSLSQSWAAFTTEHGIAYIERQSNDYSGEAVRRMLTRHLNIHLLIILNQIRTLDLSQRLAELARDLRGATKTLRTQKASIDESQLEVLIDRAVALDAEATAFLASEWWTDVTSRTQADHVLVWMQEATDLNRSVNQVVQQTRAIRESIQTLIERREHVLAVEQQKVEKAQHYTSQVMEWAIGILTFVGIPLSILLEVWINWDPTVGLSERPGPHWFIWLVLVTAGAMILGMLLARAFNIDLVPPRASEEVEELRKRARSERRGFRKRKRDSRR